MLEIQNPAELDAWAAKAKSGERMVYHLGFLMADRVVPWKAHQKMEYREPVHSIALAAMKLSDAGEVSLLQRRVGDGEFEYLAERRA